MNLSPRNRQSDPGKARTALPARRLWGAGILAAAMLLQACVEAQPTVSVSPPKGASAESALEEFAIMVATADVLGDYCRSYGIRKAYSSRDRLVADYLDKLMRAGYSRTELMQAADRLSTQAAIRKAHARLKAAGVREKDPDSFCRYGLKEIAADRPVGKLLQVVK